MKVKSYRLRELAAPVGVSLSTLGYRDFTGNIALPGYEDIR